MVALTASEGSIQAGPTPQRRSGRLTEVHLQCVHKKGESPKLDSHWRTMRSSGTSPMRLTACGCPSHVVLWTPSGISWHHIAHWLEVTPLQQLRTRTRTRQTMEVCLGLRRLWHTSVACSAVSARIAFTEFFGTLGSRRGWLTLLVGGNVTPQGLTLYPLACIALDCTLCKWYLMCLPMTPPILLSLPAALSKSVNCHIHFCTCIKHVSPR